VTNPELTVLSDLFQLEPLGKYLDMDMENLNITRHSHGVLVSHVSTFIDGRLS
jgi:hypothetical protein